jgi:hypothetical protein
MEEMTANKIIALLEKQNKKLDEVLTYLDRLDTDVSGIRMAVDSD